MSDIRCLRTGTSIAKSWALIMFSADFQISDHIPPAASQFDLASAKPCLRQSTKSIASDSSHVADCSCFDTTLTFDRSSSNYSWKANEVQKRSRLQGSLDCCYQPRIIAQELKVWQEGFAAQPNKTRAGNSNESLTSASVLFSHCWSACRGRLNELLSH
jgi:hypothetical protein